MFIMLQQVSRVSFLFFMIFFFKLLIDSVFCFGVLATRYAGSWLPDLGIKTMAPVLEDEVLTVDQKRSPSLLFKAQ